MSVNNTDVIKVKPAVFKREIKVWEYRVAGFTFEQIAQKLNYANESSARAAFKRYVTRTKDETLANEMRDLHKQRLEIALLAIWPAIENGELEAIKVMLKILERDAKLYGIDMPVKTEVEVTTYDGNYLRQRTQEIIQIIREHGDTTSGVGSDSSST